MTMTWPRLKLTTECSEAGAPTNSAIEAVRKFLLKRRTIKHKMLCQMLKFV